MGERAITLRQNTEITPCPKCGNNTRFKARSQQVAEDGCEIWVECRCGFDPTAGNTDQRVEDVWGSLDQATVRAALYYSWNDPIALQAAIQGESRE